MQDAIPTIASNFTELRLASTTELETALPIPAILSHGRKSTSELPESTRGPHDAQIDIRFLLLRTFGV